jgi:hypothetical protein
VEAPVPAGAGGNLERHRLGRAGKNSYDARVQERPDSPKFAAQWRDALYEGYEHLEMEVLAYLRGIGGTSKLDTANVIRVLGAHRQTVAEIHAIKDDEDEQAVLDTIDALIDRMRRAPDADASASGTDEDRADG